MYSAENYFWGLVGYYLGVLLLLVGLWWFCRLIPWKHPRQLLLLLVAVVFLVPIRAYPDLHFLAPAYFVALFEGATSTEPGGYLRGFIPLLISFLFALLLYISWYGYQGWRGRRSPAKKT